MRKTSQIIFSLFTFTMLIFSISSCKEQIDFSTNPADRLTFSTDTVKFDTVFTTIGSSTQQFRIYNRNNKPLIIQSINLVGNNGFSVVVDGQRGTSFSNVEIGANDSLFIFVEVKIDPQNSNNPILISDSLLFRYNGNQQRVRFEAYGQDVTLWRGKTIDTNTELLANKKFLIYDSLIIKKGVELKVNAGDQFFFHNNAFCRVDGKITTLGAVNNPVVFRGDRLDNLLPNLPYDFYSGQWKGVTISKNSFGNTMEYTQIRNGQYALRLDSSNATNTKIALLNCKFTNVSGIILQSTNCQMTALGCEFSNGGDDVVSLLGGSYEFTHCTIVNNFLFTSLTRYANPTAVHLSNYTLPDYQKYNLSKANFFNCIIYGKKIVEVLEDQPKNVTNVGDFNFLFDYCLIKANGSNDTDPTKPIHYTNILWNKDPKFINVNNDGNYRFDFSLNSLSDAIDNAKYEYALKCVTDIKGNSRTLDGKPDLGAYEKVKK